MKRYNKKLIIGMVLSLLLTIVGVTYAFFSYQRVGQENEIVTGQIYMNYVENNEILLTNIFPETKEEAFKRTDNIFNFQVTSKNTSNQDIYYGIGLDYGDEIAGMNRIRPSDIMIYLERDGEVLIDGIRYNDRNNQRIYVDKIDANTNTETTKNYTLRMWVDEKVLISDTDPKASYTTEVWNNSYASLKVNVDGKTSTMNMPLSIETGDTMVENNKAYFIAKISNYYDVNAVGRSSNDEMTLNISGTNSDIKFSYKDSEGNTVTDPSEELNLSYLFRNNKTIEVQVFVTPNNDANGETNINLKLTKNGEIVQNFRKRMKIYGNNYCLNNGFNTLYDCILVSDSLASNVETAKVNITNKGTPNLNDTAPTYTYIDQETANVSNPYSIDHYQFYFADDYEINPSTGTFKLVNNDKSSVITDYLSDKYIGYYTCGGTNMGYGSCGTVYRIKATSVSGTNYKITSADKITYKIASSIRSEVGLYKTEDDYGDSYFYRGDVTNNNVLFAGYYWKIIRTNGDGSIRLIYNGTTPNATGNYTSINNRGYTYSATYPESNSPTGARYSDPTYVGYMYGKNFERQTSEKTTYNNIAAYTKYYFADDYEFDEVNEVFKLKGNITSGTFTEMKDNFGTYPYTCVATKETSVCQVLVKVNSFIHATNVKAQYISYSSTSLDGTRTNKLSSNVKTQLENWYQTNLVGKTDSNGKLVIDYIVDSTFCNDRSITDKTWNSGYLLDKYTYYAPYSRLANGTNKTATLKCNGNIRDQFSTTSSKGNSLLKYPVALITADEVALAGGKYGYKNENYYLRTNNYYWTMTPSYFDSAPASAYVFSVRPAGDLDPWHVVTNIFDVRAVINLRSDTLISQGDGTMEKPYVVALR